MITGCNVPETDFSGYNSGSTYSLADKVIYNHKVYESLQNANIGHPPDTSPTWWLDSGFDNRWKMFDSVVGSQTAQANSITLSLVPGMIDSIALLDLDATTVIIEVILPEPSVSIFDSTLNISGNESSVLIIGSGDLTGSLGTFAGVVQDVSQYTGFTSMEVYDHSNGYNNYVANYMSFGEQDYFSIVFYPGDMVIYYDTVSDKTVVDLTPYINEYPELLVGHSGTVVLYSGYHDSVTDTDVIQATYNLTMTWA